ncbi:MAG TPA: NAD(P)/FAD-dependent oxidoreductase [Candidatus Limnocylindrales bacterium]|nr:NAD(P)/FAD-dependent oxidoreductase [Candidatus Limnocylindrales bacterium]
MSQALYDALVIGGGPGGSTVATFLARAGKRVLVLEKEHFPRFHIGESLLPYNRGLFEEMGVLEKLEAVGFPAKLGAQFHLGNASKSLKLIFRNGRFTRQTTAFQVERAFFDHLLLNHSRSSGAEVREGWAVTKFSNSQERVEIQARGDTGQTETLIASFLIDASGRANFTGNQEKLRVVHPKLKKLAVFGHFEGVVLDEGTAAGDTVIVRLENKWFWIIPLSAQKTSVGCVMDQEEFARSKQSPAEIFEQLWGSSAAMRARMAQTKLVNTIQTTSDFSYYNKRLVGPRLLRVGDAAGFMDPIFSAGVYLAMYSGKLASQLVLKSLASGHDGAPLLPAYEKRVFRAMRFYWEMVEGFYTTPFMELFMEPRPKFNLPDAITAILAGELDGGWSMDWRRRLFFWLIKLQSKWPLVPRISFKETRCES